MNRYDPNYIFKPIYFLAGVKVVVFGPDDKLLLIRRSAKTPHPGRWDLPGGGVDRGENPKVSAVREVKEETGLSISTLLPIQTCLEQEGADEAIIIGFSARTTSSKVVLSWEHTDYQWVTISESKSLNLPDLHTAIINGLGAR
ncbi:MAG: NUDIX domain-containing protein [Candidatus Saccharibacteria bacterium]